jgi:hypothetical protein
MRQLIRIIFALQICILFGVGCVVEDDSSVDTELAIASDVADPTTSEEVATNDDLEATLDGVTTAEPCDEEVATNDDAEAALDGVTPASVTVKAGCTSRRMNNQATFATCRSFCSGFGLITQSFNSSTKICRCCTAGPF